MEKVRVGIAGLGRSGWNIHAHLIGQLPELYSVAAVCDFDKNRLQEARLRFGCATYKTLTALLKDAAVELAVIATPSFLHARNTIQALKAGKHAVCEKPMAVRLSQADAMIHAARETGKTLTVFHNRRYSPDFLKVMEVIASGKLGRILLIRMAWHSFSRRWDWQTLRKFGGGLLNNTGPHAVDQALQLLGPATPEIFCRMEKSLALGDADDHVKIVLKAPGAPVIDIEITSSCAYPQENWLVMGTLGGLKGTFSKLTWKYFESSEQVDRQLSVESTPDRSYNADSIVWKPEESWKINEGEADCRLNFYRDLYETLRNKRPHPVKPEEARRVVWLTEKCYRIWDKEEKRG